MSLDTTQAIHEEFRKATWEHLMKQLKHDGDWDRFNQIAWEAVQRNEQEKAEWQQSYHMRLAEAKQIILRETHGNILEPPKPKGVESIPDKDALNFKADSRIRADHEQRLAVIKQDELDQCEELKTLVDNRSHFKGYAKSEFELSKTRSGPSRS